MAAYSYQSSAEKIYSSPQGLPQQREQEGKIEVLHKKRKAQSRAAARTPYGKYVFMGLCAFMVLMLIVSRYMSVNELTLENAAMRTTITALKSSEGTLNAKKEQMYNLAFVEDYAKNVLGMVKLDKSQIKYVELANPENMKITAKEEPDNSGGFLKSFSAVLEYLR